MTRLFAVCAFTVCVYRLDTLVTHAHRLVGSPRFTGITLRTPSTLYGCVCAGLRLRYARRLRLAPFTLRFHPPFPVFRLPTAFCGSTPPIWLLYTLDTGYYTRTVWTDSTFPFSLRSGLPHVCGYTPRLPPGCRFATHSPFVCTGLPLRCWLRSTHVLLRCLRVARLPDTVTFAF